MNKYKVGAIAGMAGPMSFLLAVVLVAALRPEYSHYGQFMSELGETNGTGAWIMNIFGFGAFSVLSAIFFLSRADTMATSDHPTSGRVALVLSLIFCLGILCAGIFSCDTTCTPEIPSAAQQYHDLASLVLVVFIIAIPIWLHHLGSLSHHQGHWWYSRVTTIVAALSLVMMIGSVDDRSGTGMYQRILVGSMWLWIAVFAWRVYRTPTTD